MKQAGIVWEEVHERLRASEAALQDVLSESPERMELVFRQRAQRLASERIESGRIAPGLPALTFRLAQERYAFELRHLAAVLPYQGCTQVPGAAPQLLGLIHLHGELLPVFDLGRVLSGVPAEGHGFVLISRRQTGWRVDAIEDLREIRRAELALAVQSRYIQGVAAGTVLLLDIDALESAVLSPKES